MYISIDIDINTQIPSIKNSLSLPPPSTRRPNRVVSGLPAVRRIVLEALQDMRRHNVRYAELRTTPRPLTDGVSRREYIEHVLRAFREFETDQACFPCEVSDGTCRPRHGEGTDKGLPRLIPRLLLSVDRGKSVQEAMAVAELAVQLRTEEEWRPYVIGVDFSGNPAKGSFEEFRSGLQECVGSAQQQGFLRDSNLSRECSTSMFFVSRQTAPPTDPPTCYALAFRPAFELARRGGMKVTVHCGEVPDGPDFLAVIAFRPERLGHAVVLSEEVREALLSEMPRIPIEVCPTSNLLTLALSDHSEHPTVQDWIREG